MMGRIAYIDFAKGCAIFGIVCYHALQRAGLPTLLQQAIAFGGTGVHLFFLLSGFGLALSQSFGSPLEFYRRRLVKVWLPYVLALTISLLAAFFFNLFPDRFDAWLAGVGLYQMFSERYIESFGGHFWFISAIIQFYIAYPALHWLRHKLSESCQLSESSGSFLFFAFAMIVSVAWWLTVYFFGKGQFRVWNSFFLQFLWEFALGMALAGLWKNGVLREAFTKNAFRDHAWWVSLPVALIFVALMALMILKMGAAGRIFNDIPALAGYAAFSVFFFQFGEKFLPPLKRFFLWVGGFSYSLYLVHILVLEVWLRTLKAAGVPANWLSLLPFLVLAPAAGLAFEKMSRRWTAMFERKKI